MDARKHLPLASGAGDLYRPLDQHLGSRSFRLITLLPKNHNGPFNFPGTIQCSLYETQLDSSSDQYEALSYRWGDPDNRPNSITINQTTVSITTNLYSALRSLRHAYESRTIWVDALSINQNDVEERSQQVSLMPEIYRNASRVISWLGLENEVLMADTKAFVLRLRSESIFLDPLLFRMLSSDYSDETVRSFLVKRYRTTPDDEEGITKAISRHRENLQRGRDERKIMEPAAVSSVLDLLRHEEEYIETVLQLRKQNWTYEAILSNLRALIGHHLANNRTMHGLDIVERTINEMEPYFQSIVEEAKRRARLGIEDLIQEALQDLAICLPTEQAVLPYSDQAPLRYTQQDSRSRSISVPNPWRYIMKFCSLKYWSRLWIVQEIILAREIVLQSGLTTMEWQTFADVFLRLKYVTRESLPTTAKILLQTPATELIRLRREYIATHSGSTSGRGINLTSILRSCQHTTCHDPRDKIYGLLGLAKGSGLVLYPDYTRTTDEIFEAIMEQTDLFRSDQLLSFSSILQEQLGGCSKASRRSTSQLLTIPLLKTRAKVNGSITILGESFTTVTNAKTLIANWQELYFHRILSHEPAANLSVTVRSALETMGSDFKRVFNVRSGGSHVRLISREDEAPEYHWDPIQHRYTKFLMSKNSGECVFCSKVEQSHLEKQHGNQTLYRESPGKSNLHIDSIPSGPSEEIIAIDKDLPASVATGSQTAMADHDHEHAPPRWVIGTRGQIGLVPSTAQVDDKICHFDGTDIVAIARPLPGNAEYYSIIGSGLMLRRWGEEEVPIYEGSEKIFRYSIGQQEKLFGMGDEGSDMVEFHLDLDTLRRLTYKPSR